MWLIGIRICVDLRLSVVANDARNNPALDRCVSDSSLSFVARDYFGRYPAVC
ncbi:hypothetical protein Rcae01_00666 [Novipirellula caenicola]|uniref:Uncharacterized protein n=1 Tax=Novipirellula caenicola TaxID=1536901 RepID=A0ABP9VJ41_9BACT